MTRSSECTHKPVSRCFRSCTQTLLERLLQHTRDFTGVVFLLCVLILSGCFPSSCRREEPHDLFASDSLSRQIAAGIPIDTLRLIRSVQGSPENAIEYPRTVLFGNDDTIYVGDVQSGVLFLFDSSGLPLQSWHDDRLVHPYLAGTRGDTLLVFSPDSSRIFYLLEGRIARQIDLPRPDDRSALQYVAGTEEAIYVKAASAESGVSIHRFDHAGQEVAKKDLRGPYWRYAGMVRTWGDTLLSLSGYRPVVDLLTPEGRVDSLALVGFDSPMLARSRAFMLGGIKEPPLLSTSAAPAGPYLFVLNLRPGWLRIDVFDRNGRLQFVLTESNSAFDREFFPIAIDVRPQDDAGYLLAVTTHEPVAQLLLYHWKGPAVE